MKDYWDWFTKTTPELVKEINAGLGITLAEAARLLANRASGRPFRARHVLRWIQDGFRLPDGTCTRLEGVRLPSCWATSRRALEEYLGRCCIPPVRRLPLTQGDGSAQRRGADR